MYKKIINKQKKIKNEINTILINRKKKLLIRKKNNNQIKYKKKCIKKLSINKKKLKMKK